MNFLHHFGRLLASLVLLVVVVAVVTFAVSNRVVVTFSFWPLPFETSMQLGAAVLIALAIGVVAGTGLMALSRSKFRRLARRNQRRVASLEKVAHEASTTLPMPAAPQTAARRVLSDS